MSQTRPPSNAIQERLQFETFLAELSATFVNVPASRIDSEIVLALQKIVEFLGIDRCGFGEVSANGKQIVITHSYELPGVAPSPRCIVDDRMPWYAREVWKGEVVKLPRIPDDLPPEAVQEREFCIQTGLKSQLTIPLKMMGTVVGGIGFASIRSFREWPTDLIERLRLVGGIFTNALDRKRSDEALKLAEQQARILRDELAHATRLELINHLAMSIAHEVNQPLCAISSNAQTALDLLSRGDMEEVKNTLLDIWSDARRGNEVIERTRRMVKKQESDRSRLCLAAMIEELIPLLSREAQAKGVKLQHEIESRELSVHCDRVQLQQVVVNLFLNAVEAVVDQRHEPPHVHIRTWRDCDKWVHVCVEDNGAGLAPQDYERVFAPYFTTKQNGLGMGLNISRSIIEAHGGSLWAASGAKRGARFQFRVPSCTSYGS